MEHKFPYKWSFKGYPASHGKTVFSTFACGGGSTMGYKLAGFDVVGANDIDPQMAKVYRENHHPKHYILAPISELLTMDLPEELYHLDILDGSPPCSTFSLAGARERTWKQNKQFREGQQKQVLSDLFFDWIKLVDRLQPKVAIAENVKGMLVGNAKFYTKRIIQEINKIGYKVQLFCLDASTMGVPQKRRRVFFICHKQSKNIQLMFHEKPVSFMEIHDDSDRLCNLTSLYLNYWNKAHLGETVGHFETHRKVNPNMPLPTVTAGGAGTFNHKYPRTLNIREMLLASTFPQDYNFLDVDPKYLMGMSVPPIMMAQIASHIYEQLLS